MVSPNYSIDKVVRILTGLEIKIYKARLDEDLCLCKKDLFIMFIRRLQHIVMLATSTRYILEDNSIKEIINDRLTKIRSKDESTVATDEVSYVVEKMYLELIEKVVNRYKITSDKLMNIENYESYLMNLENRITKLYNMIHLIFKVTYPICPLFNYNDYCTSYCKQECLNKKLFGFKNSILIPVDIISMTGYEETLYNYIVETFLGYTDPSTITFYLCGENHKDKVLQWIYEKGFRSEQIAELSECPVHSDDIKSCTRGLCDVR